jgi:hypothetical protein
MLEYMKCCFVLLLLPKLGVEMPKVVIAWYGVALALVFLCMMDPKSEITRDLLAEVAVFQFQVELRCQIFR